MGILYILHIKIIIFILYLYFQNGLEIVNARLNLTIK